MQKLLSIALILVVAVSLGACRSKPPVLETSPGVDGSDAGTFDPDASGLGDGSGTQGFGFGPQGSGDPNDPLTKRVIYFEYDSSQLTGESQVVVEAHSNWLVNNPSTTIILEGHADERGTREYNLALGEDRAKSVDNMMRALGVSADRVENISYGEERPVALGNDEAAWGLNRRVELLYTQ